MRVRNKLEPIDSWNGRPTEARDTACPCRKCYHPHDWRTSGAQPIDMRCLTRENWGCPNVDNEPVHVFSPYSRVCKRCGARKR